MATLPLIILNSSMIASAFTTSITPNILVQKKTPENLAAKALYYAENASTFNNHSEYQKELNKAKKLILSLPNSEAKQNLINALTVSIQLLAVSSHFFSYDGILIYRLSSHFL